MPRWARVLVILGSLFVGTVAYLWFFGQQTFLALLARSESRRLPAIKEVPVPLPDSSVSPVPHAKVSYFGYEFELPWDGVDETKSKTVGTIRVIAFHSGNALLFSTFPPKDFVNLIMKDANLDPRSFRQLFGEEASDSDYGFYEQMLQATPSQITPFVSRQKATAAQILLLFKGISMPRAESGIFVIQAAGFRGFQFENPQSRPRQIIDDLYSNAGGVELMFGQKTDGSAPEISQPEINRVIRSIRKIPAEPAPVPSSK